MKYARVERERRWLLAGMPSAVSDLEPSRIIDHYLDGTRMRLREVTSPDGSVVRKLTHKVRLSEDASEVANTNSYLSDEEWVRLSGLPGRRLVKDRYSVEMPSATSGFVAVDVFHEEHEGLVLAEIDGGDSHPDPDPEALAPLGVVREVTDDEAFTGGALAVAPPPGVPADDLVTALRVLDSMHTLPEGHPDIRVVKQAAGRMHRKIRKARRHEARRPLQEADEEVLARTATGSPLRIDDETKGIPLVSTVRGEYAGELNSPRGCYICHEDYTLVDAFYHWLCPRCAEMSHAKRDQGTDLTGRRALLTGGRAKIGMYIALRLLRDGAHLTITTRFPHDAVRRFAALDDSSAWIHRLKVVGIDLRDPTQVVALADDVAAAGPLDVLLEGSIFALARIRAYLDAERGGW